MVQLSSIDPDHEQPRKNFDPSSLGKLIASIEKHGIISPIIVEEVGSRYLLVDGERRFRAATELKLKEVPAIIRPPQTGTQRLIEQFHLQEQHEGWTQLEKAIAVTHLSEVMNIPTEDMAKLLGLPRGTVQDFMSFSQLIGKKEFQKAEISLNYAGSILALRRFVVRAWSAHDKEFTKDMQEDLERVVIARIRNGDIARPSHIIKIKDAVTSDHTSIIKYMKNASQSTDKLFTETNAKAAALARRLVFTASFAKNTVSQLRSMGALNLIEENPVAMTALKNLVESVNPLLK